MNTALSSDLVQKIDVYWRAANYLSVGQIYLYDNALLKVPLSLDHIKPRLLGQHAKWLDVADDIPWRRPVASLSYLLSSCETSLT